jgi:hypothetical protein
MRSTQSFLILYSLHGLKSLCKKERGLFAKAALVWLGLTTSSRSKNPT